VVVEEAHPLNKKFLRAADLGLAGKGQDDSGMVMDASSGALVLAKEATAARIFHTGPVQIGSRQVTVKTSLQLLLEEAQKYTLAQYSTACGVAEATIVRLAREFTSHGRRAVADCHGGTMHSNGFYTSYAIVMLNGMVGNLNWKGGTSAGGGRFPDFGRGPRYNFKKYPGKVKPTGVPISREFQYEKTTEFKLKKEQGNPYPAEGPWYPFSAAIQGEYISGALNSYPYPLKAMILWNTNPIYGQAGLYSQAKAALADPGRLPLIISIDPFINETSAFADYIVPDTVLYESWGSAWPWAAHLTKTNSFRWPVVEPPLAKTKENIPICMESFIIAVAKKWVCPALETRQSRMRPASSMPSTPRKISFCVSSPTSPLPENRCPI
jgi:tetrathionate reductase subunit A